jgi:hypothetical protein
MLSPERWRLRESRVRRESTRTCSNTAWSRAYALSTERAFLQRGQVLLLSLVVLIGIGGALFVSGASREVTRVTDADGRTRAVLERAREALTAYAVAHVTHPASLPCPDTDDDGIADGAASCVSYIGRLPWRTLGAGDLRDEAGERLWYAVSENFRDDPAVQINSDTKGNRTVYSGGKSTIATSEAAAVIFAPGPALPGQVRDGSLVQCLSPLTGSVRRDRCAANYLERDTATGAAWNNASASGPYMRARSSMEFNDRLLVVRTNDFIPLVERRLARELRELLREYHAASDIPSGCDCFPWPDTSGSGASNPSANRGRVPVKAAAPHHWMRKVADITQGNPAVVTTTVDHGYTTGQTVYLADIAGMTQLNDTAVTVTVIDATRFSIDKDSTTYSAYTSGGRAWSAVGSPAAPVKTPALPPYFVANNWASTMYYTVARTSLESSGAACTTCTASSTLAIDGASGYALVLITPGPVAAGQTRTRWAHYLDDAPNRDIDRVTSGGAAADPAADDAYVRPPAVCAAGQCPATVDGVTRCVASSMTCPRNVTAPARDRLYLITATGSYAQCQASAAALLSNAPCHTKGTNVKPACKQAADNLLQAGCSCAPAGTVMITPPCRNTLNPGACQAAVAMLKGCT